MAQLPRLTESDISRWTGGRSFERGQTYFRQGAIYNPIRRVSMLKAQCMGSQPEPYHVEIELGAEGIVTGRCSCPVGEGGRCKHAAALLLTWVSRPKDFLELEDLQTLLRKRDKEDLIRLVRRMIERHPDLESLLELPAPDRAETVKRIDPELIRRQVIGAFRSAGDDWRDAWNIARQLDGALKMGEDYAQAGDLHNARTVYQAVAWEILQNYETVQEEEGELVDVVNQCIEGIKPCLAATADPDEREAILRGLFDLYRWDVDYGGIGAGEEVPEIIIELATPEEKELIAEWVQEAMPEGGSWSQDYHRQIYGGFLLDLTGEELDDESFLAICRKTGRLQDLVARLLDLNRTAEAVNEARTADDSDLLSLAGLFEAQNNGNLVEELIQDRSKTSKDRRLVEWLKQRAARRGDIPEALRLAEQLFWVHPSVKGYEEIKSMARQLSRWDELRPQLMNRLEENRQYALLIEVHLLEEEIDSALKTLKHSSALNRAWEGSPLSIRVAGAAEKSRPHEAITLYVEAADRIIKARDRKNYAQAVEHLGRVRALYRSLGEEKTWQSFIADLREKNRRLTALKDELNRGGL